VPAAAAPVGCSPTVRTAPAGAVRRGGAVTGRRIGPRRSGVRPGRRVVRSGRRVGAAWRRVRARRRLVGTTVIGVRRTAAVGAIRAGARPGRTIGAVEARRLRGVVPRGVGAAETLRSAATVAGVALGFPGTRTICAAGCCAIVERAAGRGRPALRELVLPRGAVVRG